MTFPELIGAGENFVEVEGGLNGLTTERVRLCQNGDNETDLGKVADRFQLALSENLGGFWFEMLEKLKFRSKNFPWSWKRPRTELCGSGHSLSVRMERAPQLVVNFQIRTRFFSSD